MIQDTVLIPLQNGMSAIIDAADYPEVSRFKWHAAFGNGWYVRREGPKTADGIRSRIYMHRDILGLTDSPEIGIDHANRDGLDNRRSNLRLCTQSENCVNRIYPSKFGLRGVYTLPAGQIGAKIQVNKKRIFLGTFPSIEEAGAAYDLAAMEHFGKFAVLNFPATIAPAGAAA